MTVWIPTPLQSYTRASRVEAEGATLAELLWDLDRQFPGLRFRIVDEQDQVRRHIKLFIGPLHNDDLTSVIPREPPGPPEIHIIAALSGG